MLLNRLLNKPKLHARVVTETRKGGKVKEATIIVDRNNVTRWRIALDRFTTVEIEVRF